MDKKEYWEKRIADKKMQIANEMVRVNEMRRHIGLENQVIVYQTQSELEEQGKILEKAKELKAKKEAKDGSQRSSKSNS